MMFNQRWLTLPLTSTFLVMLLMLINSGCQKNNPMMQEASTSVAEEARLQSATRNMTEINLVSDATEYQPAFIDANLVNAWGIAFSDEGEAWISSADQGVTTIYNHNGEQIMPAINIPFGSDPNGGAPTGVVYNNTPSFMLTSSSESTEFIYATENGTIVAIASEVAHTVADRSLFNAVYKGLAIGQVAGHDYLYATDFRNATIDVFDQNFNYVSTMTFTDPNMPAHYAPFGIRNIDGVLYVTYAKQLLPEMEDDDAGQGHGYVDIYHTDGSFIKRFVSASELNSPWGIEKSLGQHGAILIGNFGNGKINVYDSEGNFLWHLKNGQGDPIVIDGLWGLTFPGANLQASNANRLYFTAGPDDESHGVFGYLNPNQ